MSVVNSNGVDIVYDVLGDRSGRLPIFFIAGLNGRRKACAAQSVPFSRERMVVVHDQRGTGESGKPADGYSISAMADDVVAIMDKEGIQSAHFVGTSTGGVIAQSLCVHHPERVASAAIVCSYMKPDPYIRRQLEMRKLILERCGTAVLTRLVSTMLNDPRYFSDHYDEIVKGEDNLIQEAGAPHVDLGRMNALLAFDESEGLKTLQIPSFVLTAENDAVCPPHYSGQLAATIPGARIKLYRTGGHFFYRVFANEFNDDIRNFIDTVEAHHE